VVSISAADCHTMIVTNDGSAWGIGCNSNSQIGDGTSIRRVLVPSLVKAGSGEKRLGTGGHDHGAKRSKTETEKWLELSLQATSAILVASRHAYGRLEASFLPWSFPHHARYRVDELEMDGQKAAFFASLVANSCVKHRKNLNSDVWMDASILKITKVEAVFNPRLQKKYEQELSDIYGKLQTRTYSALPELEKNKVAICDPNPDCLEFFLLHGAHKDKINHIITGGLDPRRGGASAGRLFGQASYLAINASKADLYTDEDPRQPSTCKHEQRKVIVMRVALGSCHRTKTPMRERAHPPDASDGKPMDSVLAETRSAGGCVDHLEIMVYNPNQMLPVAVVTYEHEFTCRCALCARRCDMLL